MSCSKCITSLFLNPCFGITSIRKVVKHIINCKNLIDLRKPLSDFSMTFNNLRGGMAKLKPGEIFTCRISKEEMY